jgi:hypothetical protein
MGSGLPCALALDASPSGVSEIRATSSNEAIAMERARGWLM